MKRLSVKNISAFGSRPASQSNRPPTVQEKAASPEIDPIPSSEGARDMESVPSSAVEDKEGVTQSISPLTATGTSTRAINLTKEEVVSVKGADTSQQPEEQPVSSINLSKPPQAISLTKEVLEQDRDTNQQLLVDVEERATSSIDLNKAAKGINLTKEEDLPASPIPEPSPTREVAGIFPTSDAPPPYTKEDVPPPPYVA